MSGPWEKYKSVAVPSPSGPWVKYQAQKVSVPTQEVAPMSRAEPIETESFGTKAKRYAGDVLSAPFRGWRGLGVAAQRLVSGDSLVDAAQSASRNVQPGAVPQSGEKIGAFVGSAAPLLPLGVGAGIAASMAGSGSEKLAETGSVTEGAEEAAITGGVGLATMGAMKGAGKGWTVLIKGFKKLQEVAAGSAVGGIKSVLNKIRGGADSFGKSAVAMQEKGVITGLAGAPKMLERTEAIKKAAGDQMGDIHKAIDALGPTIQPDDIANTIRQELTPKVQGGYGDRLQNTVDTIVDTIKGSGDDPITLEKLQEIKEVINPGKWGTAQIAAMGEDGQRVFDLRHRATAILGKKLEEAVEKNSVTPKLKSDYKEAKQVFGMASDVAKGLKDKVDRAQGKRFLDPFATLGSAGAIFKMLANQPAQAAALLGAVGVEKYVERFGPQQGAILFRAVAKTMDAMRSGIAPAVPGLERVAVQSSIHGFKNIIKKAKAKNR